MRTTVLTLPRLRRRNTTLAVAAALSGLLVLAHPAGASAAEKNATDSPVETTVLHPTVSGADGSVRYSLASLRGGGVQVSFVYAPDDAAGEKSGRDEVQAKEFTITVDAEALATQTVTDDGGAIVPAAATDDDQADDDQADVSSAGAVVDQEASAESTEVTLKATTEGVATVWLLPKQAPAAADPDDQNWVTRTWHALWAKISGDDSSESSEASDQDEEIEETPTAEATSSPSASSKPSSSSSASSSSSSSSATSATEDSSTESGDDEGSGDEEADAAEDEENADGESTATEDSTSDESEAEGDTCVVTQGESQLTTTLADDDTVDAPLEDGPSAAPTFSDEVRAKAAQQASECGEGADDDGASDDDDTSAGSTSSSTPSSGKTKIDVAAGDWLSGISGGPDARRPVEEMRGSDAEVATTWADSSGSVAQLGNGSEYGADKWNRSLILALPPFPEGSSWEDTAAGKNDDYLQTTFATAKEKWGDRDGQLFIEYGYEMNGYWMWWNAKAGQEDVVAQAFERARSIQQEEFPEALLGVRFNHESNGYDGNSEDLIAAVKSDIDFIGTSYYNAYPPVFSKEEFDERATMRDGGGGPKGIATWLSAAKTAGLPIEFGEWAESAKDGDSPAFIEGMHDTFSQNAGPGAGQIFAESYFQITKDNDNWRINSGKVPESAKAYAEAFSDVG